MGCLLGALVVANHVVGMNNEDRVGLAFGIDRLHGRISWFVGAKRLETCLVQFDDHVVLCFRFDRSLNLDYE